MRLMALAVVLVFALQGSSGAGAIPYEEWSFHYSGDWGNISYGDGARVVIDNGAAYLNSSLGEVQEDAIISLNISVEVSPESVSSGIKIVLSNQTVVDEKLVSGEYSINFHSTGSGDILIILYDYGGNMSVHLSPLHIRIPESGLSVGLSLSVVGITIVFLVLGILAGVMYLLKPRVEESVERENEIVEEVSEMDPELVAAITAAISAYLGEKRFKIISVKPSPWKYYGRYRMMRRLK